MKVLGGIAVLVAAAAVAAPTLAQPAPASFRKMTSDQKRQLNEAAKAPGPMLAGPTARSPTFECQLAFTRASIDVLGAVLSCSSLDSPAAGSPIDKYNKATPAQQFATCGTFADEFACFREKLIPDQNRFCQQATAAQLAAAEKAKALCVAKVCAEISLRTKASENTIRDAEQQLAQLNKVIADARKAIADAQRDQQQARCN
ncbi:MAG TPA: hypothetical protein VE129_16090 [Thermoanaerobaculia bacterium]|nr:hypothetical protein [Thermoanaerobaculia bacterium]